MPKIPDRKSLEELTSSVPYRSLLSAVALWNSLTAAGYTFDEFVDWLGQVDTSAFVSPGEKERLSFLIKHRSAREKFKAISKTPCNPCGGKGNNVKR